MNSTGREILSSPDPQSHIVYAYNDDSQLTEAVCLFAAAGIRKIESVLLILSDRHYHSVREFLEQDGFDLEELESTGHLLFYDARGLLSSFLFDGILDELKFKMVVGALIEKAKGGNKRRKNRQVRVFGEMVDLILKLHPKTTERLEQLWNDVIAQHSVPLLCAYSLSGPQDALPSGIHSCHSHALA